MVPLIELRGAIPYAVAFGIPLTQAYIIAIIGNMLPVPFIYFFARKVLEWGKDKPVIGRFFTFCLEKGKRAARHFRQRPDGDCFWRCFCSSESRFRVQAPGPELWLPAFWIWISSPAFLQLCWGSAGWNHYGSCKCRAVWGRCSRCSANCGSRISTQKRKHMNFIRGDKFICFFSLKIVERLFIPCSILVFFVVADEGFRFHLEAQSCIRLSLAFHYRKCGCGCVLCFLPNQAMTFSITSLDLGLWQFIRLFPISASPPHL